MRTGPAKSGHMRPRMFVELLVFLPIPVTTAPRSALYASGDDSVRPRDVTEQFSSTSGVASCRTYLKHGSGLSQLLDLLKTN